MNRYKLDELLHMITQLCGNTGVMVDLLNDTCDESGCRPDGVDHAIIASIQLCGQGKAIVERYKHQSYSTT